MALVVGMYLSTAKSCRCLSKLACGFLLTCSSIDYRSQFSGILVIRRSMLLFYAAGDDENHIGHDDGLVNILSSRGYTRVLDLSRSI